MKIGLNNGYWSAGPPAASSSSWPRPMYIGGMGAKGANFHYEVFARMGYEAECATIQDLYLDGRKADAIAAVPTALVEDVALIGPIGKLAEEAEQWKSTVISTALVTGPQLQFETIMELLA